IRVGATFNLAFGLLPAVLAKFRENYPGITIDLVATPDGYSPLQPDDTDIGFRTLEPGTRGHDEMVGRRLGRLPVAIYGTRRYLNKSAPLRTATDLAEHQLILGAQNLSHIAAVKWMEKASASVEPVYRASSMLLMLAAVRDELGLACLPCYLGDGEKGLVRILDLDATLAAELWILRHPHHRDTARMRAFSEFVSNSIPDLL
ncbi:MAG: LysR substrate-binding domain-containing protein, partial [Alphaproteobacteria bacterium]